MVAKKKKDPVRKLFIIDTNIILNDYSAPFSISDVDIVLPFRVIRELDKLYENKSASYNARAFKRKLKSLLSETSLNEIELPNKSKLILESSDDDTLVDTLKLDSHKSDSYIIASAYRWFIDEGRDVTLLTNDVGMWVIARSLGIPSEDYRVHKGYGKGDHAQSDLYSGVRVIHLEEFAKTEEDFNLISSLYMDEECFLSEQQIPGLYLNQVIVLKSELATGSVIVMFKGYNKPLKRLKDFSKMCFSGIKPLNKEQSFAYEFFADEQISCVTIAGRAGTGKSIVTLSYALASIDQKKFDRIMIIKPIAPVGKDLGFLPGSLEEKLEPWMDSFKDSFKVIFKEEEEHSYIKDGKKVGKKEESVFQYYFDNKLIEFHPLTFMRGRSLMNTLVILDESQNTSLNEMKTLLTRIGEGSKIICLGDVDQIDMPHLDRQNNGLAYLIERGRDSDLIGHITFIKDHRSGLSNWASDNL